MVLFAGMGTKKHARTLAWSSFLYKVGGILLLLPLYRILPSWGSRLFSSPEGSIAFIQSVLIWGNALLLLPLAKPLARGGALLAELFGREDPGEPLYLEFPPPPFSNLALSLLSKEMVRGTNLMEECLFRTLRTPWASERISLLTRGAEDLMESCTEYLLALPPPLEEPRSPGEYTCLAHSLGCMRELNNLALRNFLPQYQRWRELSRKRPSPQEEEWDDIEKRLLLIVNESFGSFALGDSKPSRKFIKEYRAITNSLEELQAALETTRGLFHTPENLRLWELSHTLRSMVQRCFCLVQGCSMGEIESLLWEPSERMREKK
jgi:phosphate:Na+ symporter